MNARMIIDIGPDGAVMCMNREGVFDVGFLGNRSIRRATDIRFNETTQSWDIWVAAPAHGIEAFIKPSAPFSGFPTYEDARGHEVDWMEECLLQDYNPVSSEAADLMARMRERIAIC